MAQYQHPDGSDSPQFIGVYREFKVEVDDDGTYETDVDPETLVEHGFLDADESDEQEVCTVTKTDGEECGRELPCAYHDGGD